MLSSHYMVSDCAQRRGRHTWRLHGWATQDLTGLHLPTPDRAPLHTRPPNTHRSPLVSFVYERGWRQGFAWAGFPGADREYDIAMDYLLPAAGGKVLVDMSCGSGLFSRRWVHGEAVVAWVGGVGGGRGVGTVDGAGRCPRSTEACTHKPTNILRVYVPSAFKHTHTHTHARTSRCCCIAFTVFARVFVVLLNTHTRGAARWLLARPQALCHCSFLTHTHVCVARTGLLAAAPSAASSRRTSASPCCSRPASIVCRREKDSTAGGSAAGGSEGRGELALGGHRAVCRRPTPGHRRRAYRVPRMPAHVASTSPRVLLPSPLPACRPACLPLLAPPNHHHPQHAHHAAAC